MNGSTRIILAAVVLTAQALVTSAPAPASDRTEGLARMAGVWQLDSRVSDDPLRMARGVRPPRPDGDQEASRSLLEERLRPYTEAANVLTISHEDPALTIKFWDDRERVLVVNGKKTKVDGPRGPVEVEVDWGSSDRLVVKTTGDPAGKIVEIFEIGGRGEKLFHTVDLYRKGTKRRFTFQRLYNRLEATD